MELWQYQAWCDASDMRRTDQIQNEIHGAYWNAYWNSAAKHKKSLKKVLELYHENKQSALVPINFEELDAQFKLAEEMKQNGLAKYHNV